MNRTIHELTEIIEDKTKAEKVYWFLFENDLLNLEKVAEYNSFRNNKMSNCKHTNLIDGCGLTFCADCGWDDLHYG